MLQATSSKQNKLCMPVFEINYYIGSIAAVVVVKMATTGLIIRSSSSSMRERKRKRAHLAEKREGEKRESGERN